MGRTAKGSIDDYRGRKRVRFKGGLVGLFDSEEEAAEALAIARGAAAYAKGEPGAVITLRPYGEAWFVEREKAGFVRSVARERSVWRQHILTAPFIDWSLPQIENRPRALIKWLEGLAFKNAVDVYTTGARPVQGTVDEYRGKFRARRAGQHVGLYDTEEEARRALDTTPDAPLERAQVYTETDRRLSKKTITNIRHVLKQILASAEIDRLIKRNPITKDMRVRVHARVREEELWTFLTADEIDRFTRSLRDERQRAFFSVAIYGGLRQGEILGLRWRDVVLDRNEPLIRVRRNRDGAVKTEQSIRDVRMLYPLYDALQEWHAATLLEAAKGRSLRATVIDINALVFPTDHGACFHEGYDCGFRDRKYRKKGVLKLYPGLRSKAGLTRPGLVFHSLRHTCASHLAMGTAGFPKADRDEIKRWLGHSSIKVTERYMHLDPAALNARVGRLFRFELQTAEQKEATDAAG